MENNYKTCQDLFRHLFEKYADPATKNSFWLLHDYWRDIWQYYHPNETFREFNNSLDD